MVLAERLFHIFLGGHTGPPLKVQYNDRRNFFKANRLYTFMSKLSCMKLYNYFRCVIRQLPKTLG